MVWLNFIESAGNHLLSLDPEFLEQLPPFYGKTFRIELTGPKYTFDLRPCPDGFIIAPETDSEATVTLSGSLWAFAQLGKHGLHSDVFERGRIRMQGDTDLGQDFQRVLASLQIDWDELISSLLGDMAAHNIHRAASEVKSWLSQSVALFQENTGEILQQEIKAAPAAVEVNALSEEIETLRSDLARFEARLAKYSATINNKETENDA